MGKNKSSSQQVKAAKSSKDAQVKAISSVKEGAITKPSQTPKSKTKEIAKIAALKVDKAAKGDKKSKKAKKEPTPEPSSSEAEIDEEATSASSASSGDHSEAEPVKAVPKSSRSKVNGSAKASAKVEAAEESSDSSESSGDEVDDRKHAAPKPAPVVIKENGAAKHKASSDEDNEGDSEEDSEADSEVDSEEESEAVAGAADSKALNGVPKKLETQQSNEDSDSEESSESESGSEVDSDSEKDESEEETVASKKRKADADHAPTAKKSKTEATGDDAEKKNLFVGQLSWNVDEDWLTREFEPYGELIGVRVITDKNTGRSKGFGYIEFANSADAIKAQKEKHGVSIDNRAINVDFSNPRVDGASGQKERSKSYGDQKSPPSDTIFVANIPFGATEDMLGEEFGKHGNVIGVRLPTHPEDGTSKGFGYVQFSSVDEASGALKNMEGASVGGRPLRLDFSTPRSNTGDSPRGGRGGRGGGRGFDRGGRGGGRGRGGFGGDRGGRGGGRGGSTNRGGFGDFKGKKMTFN